LAGPDRIAWGGLIRVDVDHTLLKFGTDDLNIFEVTPSHAVLDENDQQLVRSTLDELAQTTVAHSA
jgi:hypothetical protein